MTKDQQATRLIWGVKQSFRSYVEATGGTIAADHGAERVADGAFAFAPAAGGNSGAALGLDGSGKPHGQSGFSGEVLFQAHGGMLSVRLADPIVEIDAAGGRITVLGDERSGRLEIARLDPLAMTEGDAGEILIPASLSMDGSFLLGDHYPPGTALDPIRLIFTAIAG